MEHWNDAPDIDISGFMKWKTVRRRIFIKLINAAQNKELLEMMPHRMFLDLAAVYYVVIDDTEGQGIGTVLIRNEHMEMWGQDEATLNQMAMLNMHSSGGPYFDSIEVAIKRILPDADDLMKGMGRHLGTGMYVLSNQRKFCGASEILDDSTLQMIADKIGDGFIVLPSSIHEVIVLEPDDAAEYGKLADMVKEVNTTQVSAEERLSDHVYVYNRREKMLKIAT